MFLENARFAELEREVARDGAPELALAEGGHRARATLGRSVRVDVQRVRGQQRERDSPAARDRQVAQDDRRRERRRQGAHERERRPVLPPLEHHLRLQRALEEGQGRLRRTQRQGVLALRRVEACASCAGSLSLSLSVIVVLFCRPRAHTPVLFERSAREHRS